MRHRYSVWFVIVLAGLLNGCSDSDGIGQVSGTVTLDGKPLPRAMVYFQSEQPGRPSTDITDSDGNYTLEYTYEISGALVGNHRVDIRTETPKTPDGPAVEEYLPARYHDESELTAEVKEGSNEINFDLTSVDARR